MKNIIKKWLNITTNDVRLIPGFANDCSQKERNNEVRKQLQEYRQQSFASFARVQSFVEELAKILGYDVIVVESSNVLDTDIVVCISDESGNPVILRKIQPVVKKPTKKAVKKVVSKKAKK